MRARLSVNAATERKALEDKLNRQNKPARESELEARMGGATLEAEKVRKAEAVQTAGGFELKKN
ncbi:MAG: hypothetical protein LBD32_02740 [Cytophagales bacterium]|nr:hypothetical protein [Cytophagales bacterium]